MKKMSMKEEFKKNIIVVGAATAMTAATVGVAGVAYEKSDFNLAKYDVGNDNYIDYIDGSEIEKLKRMTELDDKIDKYKKLSSKIITSKEEKEELENIRSYLEKEMSSGYLANFYLKDILKEKIKFTYNKVSEKEIKYVKTRWDIDNICITMYDKYGRATYMDEKDKVAPLRSALEDIATLQSYEGRDTFSKMEVSNFIMIHKNMKGFSNLEFIKTKGEPLSYAQIDLDEELDR